MPDDEVPEEIRRKVTIPGEDEEPVGIGFVLRSLGVLVGGFIFLAGLTNTVAVTLFDEQGPPAVFSFAVALVGALIAAIPLAQATRDMVEVRARERESDGE